MPQAPWPPIRSIAQQFSKLSKVMTGRAPELGSTPPPVREPLPPLRGVRGPSRLVAQLAGDSLRRWRLSASLRHSFLIWSGLGLVLTAGSGLSAGWLGGRLGAGLAFGLLWWVVTTAFLFVALDLTRTYPGNVPVDRLGLPNGLTVVRAYMALPILLYATMPGSGLARDLFLCIAAPVALLDAADGWLARRAGQVTVLGRALDPIMDATFFSLSAVACLFLGFIPLWVALLVLARFGLAAIGFLVLYPWLPRRPEMVATRFGKVNTFASGVCLAGSSLLALAGDSALDFDLVLGAVVAATALGQILTLMRRGLQELGSQS